MMAFAAVKGGYRNFEGISDERFVKWIGKFRKKSGDNDGSI